MQKDAIYEASDEKTASLIPSFQVGCSLDILPKAFVP